MPTWAGDAMALACALAWAAAVLLFRRVDPDVKPAALNLFKNVVASALLLVTMLATGGRFDTSRSPRDWLFLVGSGVLGLAVADTLFLAGLRRIDASIAAVTDCAYSPTVLVLSSLWLGEALTGRLLIGAPLVVIGLFIVSWQRPGSARIDRGGVALAIAGVVTTAFGVVLAKPALDRSVLVEATTIRLIAGSVALFVFQIVTGGVRAGVALFRPQRAWRAAIPATILGTYVAMILWLGGMKYGTASRSALLNQMGAIFVLILSRLAGEIVPTRRWIGAIVAVSGVAVLVAR